MSDELTSMRAQLRDLSRRVEALEADSGVGAPAAPGLGQENDWVGAGLSRERSLNPELTDGVLLVAGTGALPSGRELNWQILAGLRETLSLGWAERAMSLAALAHPVRMELVRHILLGVTATAELAALDTLGTTGQLHHHLRQLVAAGWVAQSGRGTYEVPADRVAPLLALAISAIR